MIKKGNIVDVCKPKYSQFEKMFYALKIIISGCQRVQTKREENISARLSIQSKAPTSDKDAPISVLQGHKGYI